MEIWELVIMCLVILIVPTAITTLRFYLRWIGMFGENNARQMIRETFDDIIHFRS